jgi:hypothetical protein
MLAIPCCNNVANGSPESPDRATPEQVMMSPAGRFPRPDRQPGAGQVSAPSAPSTQTAKIASSARFWAAKGHKSRPS